MISQTDFETVVGRANLAPSVHNVQPTRWRLEGDVISLFADLGAGLAVGDPSGADMALSCGAALEATLLALGDLNLGAEVENLWDQGRLDIGPSHRLVAKLHLQKGAPDPLGLHLENRFTWRAMFSPKPVKTWQTDTAKLISDPQDIDWIAMRNDWASLEIMKARAFRQELLGWMRLSEGHPRYHLDGLSREALQMPKRDALLARWALGPLWPILHLFGATKDIIAEAEKTKSAGLIACFHRPVNESPATSGRAYLRLCLNATARGLAGWPMAALSDNPATRKEICEKFKIGPDRRLVQVLRFGKAGQTRPPKARRPLKEIIL